MSVGELEALYAQQRELERKIKETRERTEGEWSDRVDAMAIELAERAMEPTSTPDVRHGDTSTDVVVEGQRGEVTVSLYYLDLEERGGIPVRPMQAAVVTFRWRKEQVQRVAFEELPSVSLLWAVFSRLANEMRGLEQEAARSGGE